jgi:signal transduction histidine kinase
MWKKVIAPTLLVCVCWVLVSGVTTYWIYRFSREHDSILTENVASIRAAGRLQESLWRMQAAFVDALEDGPDTPRSDFKNLETQFAAGLAAADAAAVTALEKELVKTMREQFDEYRGLIDISLKNDQRDRAANTAAADQSSELAGRIAEQCTEYLQINERLMSEATARGARLERGLYLIRMFFLVAGPLVGIWLGLHIARGLQSSISRISVTLNDTSGELDQEIGSVSISPMGNPDELTRLNDQVQAVSGRIRQVLSELHKARNEVLRADRLAVVGEMAAGVAHELRNPLTSVKLLLQTAPRSGPAIQLQDRQAKVVLQEISRIEETISTLLDFARPPALHRVKHDLRDTLRRALSLVEGRANQAGVVVVSTLPDAPLVVDADPDQLHQVFGNLFINGIESMSREGTLQVTAELASGAAPVARVRVIDSGSGIPQQALDRIFDPFMTTKERGIGLGLAVTRRIVQEHEGRIFAGNRPVAGAVFTVELPIAGPADNLAQRIDEPQAGPPLNAVTAAEPF